MTIYGWIWARFYPDTSDGGSPSGLNLHACLRTKEHAAVWFQGRKKTQVRRWYIYIAHKVTKLKHRIGTNAGGLWLKPQHCFKLQHMNTRRKKWRKRLNLSLSDVQSRLSCSPLPSRSRLWVGGVGLLTGWRGVEFFSGSDFPSPRPSLEPINENESSTGRL